MKVGEYIRTKDGQVGKVIEIKKRKELADQIYLDIRCNDEFYDVFVYDFDIKSHSKNIIDLIEVGDIINGEEIEECKTINNKKIAISETCYFTNKDIEEILTHEMYEQNCYKVGED